jgi:CheY-like chemotaxis protein
MAAPTENQTATLLIVDQDPVSRQRLRDLFETGGYRAVTASEPSSALRVLNGVRCDLVVLDIEMPGIDGPRSVQVAARSTNHEQVTEFSFCLRRMMKGAKSKHFHRERTITLSSLQLLES